MAKMYKLCKCGAKILITEYLCQKCKKSQISFSNKTYDKFSRSLSSLKFYNSAKWKKARARVKIEEPFCRICGKKADVIDHIIPIKAGGSKLARNNLQALCHACHNKKTLSDKAIYDK